jgi:hypothetical protein
VVGGLLVRGLVGDLLDDRDKRLQAEAAARALETAPTGQSVAWKNPDSGHSGTVTPTKIIALALTIGVFWGAAILIVASANLIWPSYGRTFLDVIASVYRGYHPGFGPGSVITGASTWASWRRSEPRTTSPSATTALRVLTG